LTRGFSVFCYKNKNLDLTKHSIIWSRSTSHEAGDKIIKNLQFDFLQRFASSSSFCRAAPRITAAMWLIVSPLMFKLSPPVVSRRDPGGQRWS